MTVIRKERRDARSGHVRRRLARRLPCGEARAPCVRGSHSTLAGLSAINEHGGEDHASIALRRRSNAPAGELFGWFRGLVVGHPAASDRTRLRRCAGELRSRSDESPAVLPPPRSLRGRVGEGGVSHRARPRLRILSQPNLTRAVCGRGRGGSLRERVRDVERRRRPADTSHRQGFSGEVGAVVLARRGRRGSLSAALHRDPDPPVHRHAAFGERHPRVHVHLADGVVVADELRDALDGLLHGGQVAGGLAAHALAAARRRGWRAPSPRASTSVTGCTRKTTSLSAST